MLKVGVAPLTIFGQPVPSTRAYRANVLAEFHQCNLTCTCRDVSAKAVTDTHTNTHIDRVNNTAYFLTIINSYQYIQHIGLLRRKSCCRKQQHLHASMLTEFCY